MKVLSLALFIFLILAISTVSKRDKIEKKEKKKAFRFKKDKEVLELTKKDFKNAFESFGPLMVMFYVPNCIHCKETFNEYYSAADILKNRGLNIAKVNCETKSNQKLCDQYNVEGYPTILVMQNADDKQRIEFGGMRKKEHLSDFFLKHRGPIVETLTTADQLKNFIKDNYAVVVFFGNRKKPYENFVKSSRMHGDYLFGTCKGQCVRNIKKVTSQRIGANSVVIFKKYDDKINIMNFSKKLSIGDLERFLDDHLYPKVMNFNIRVAEYTFGHNHSALYLYCKENTKEWDEYYKLLYKISDKILSQGLKIVITDINNELSEKLAEFIGMNKTELPTVRIHDTQRGDPIKFKMEGKINEENILKFVDDYKNNRIKPYYKSEYPLPESKNNGPVRIVVGTTFRKEVLESKKNVLIFIYAPWCTHCYAMEDKYVQSAQMLSLNEDLVIAKMDGTTNECEDLNIETFPSVRLYKNGQKPRYDFYNGDRTPNDLVNWVNQRMNRRLKIIPFEDVVSGEVERIKKEHKEKQNKINNTKENKKDSNTKDTKPSDKDATDNKNNKEKDAKDKTKLEEKNTEL